MIFDSWSISRVRHRRLATLCFEIATIVEARRLTEFPLPASIAPLRTPRAAARENCSASLRMEVS